MSNAVVLGSSNDEEVNSPLLNTPEPSNFLFVNETIDTPSFKQRKRRDVKSHVRRVAHEQFRKSHKTAQKRATTLPRYATLASQNLDSEASKDLEHDRDCPSRGSPITSRGTSNADSDSLSGLTLDELYESESPTNTPIPSTVDESPEPSEVQRAYCKACGEPLQRLRHVSKDRSLIGRSFKRRVPLPNPVGVLGAGQSLLDLTGRGELVILTGRRPGDLSLPVLGVQHRFSWGRGLGEGARARPLGVLPFLGLGPARTAKPTDSMILACPRSSWPSGSRCPRRWAH